MAQFFDRLMKIPSIRNERGSIIIVAIIVLVLVTILGITATNTSNVEVQIAANDQFIKMAFYNADSALYGTAKLVSLSINESNLIASGSGNDAPGITYMESGDDFYDQIAGFDDYDEGEPDINFAPGGINATADVRRIGQRYASGGGAEFGGGVTASALIIDYEISSSGTTDRGANSALSATYRKVVGMPGGL